MIYRGVEVGYLMSSQKGGSPYLHLTPDVWEEGKGVDWFFANRIYPKIEQGCRRFTLHNPFGLYTKPGTMDFDSLHRALNGGATWAKGYCSQMLFYIKRLNNDERIDAINIYIGALTHGRLKSLDSFQRYEVAIYYARTFRNMKKVNIVFDAIGSPKVDSKSDAWLAFQLNQKLLGEDRVMMEPLPHKDSPHQWGMPAFALEPRAKSQLSRQPSSHFGPVTRFFERAIDLDKDDPVSTLHKFIEDCHRRGHGCVIADHVVRWAGTTYAELQAFADSLNHSEFPKSSSRQAILDNSTCKDRLQVQEGES